MSPTHRRPGRAQTLIASARWFAEDSRRAIREWRPPERPEQQQERRRQRRRPPEPTWGRSPGARAVRSVVQRRALFPLLTALGRPEVVGVQHLHDTRPPYILAPNHASHADAPLVLQALPEHIRERTLVPAAADYFFDRRPLRVVVTLTMNAVPFDRTDEIADSVRRCERFLRHGHSIVLFPEGTRSHDGRLRGFKAGVAHLAVQTGAPVIPVYVQGTHGLLPRGSALPRPSAVTVHFGAPLSAGLEESARHFNARLEQAVTALGTSASGYAHHDQPPAPLAWAQAWRASAGRGVERRTVALARIAGGAGGDGSPPSGSDTGGGQGQTDAGWIERWRSSTPR